MTDINSLGFSVDSSPLHRIGTRQVHREMKRILGLMDKIKAKPPAEQIALIRAHVAATAHDVAVEAAD